VSDPAPESDAAARRLLRRIAWCFLIVVATLPLVMLGGQWRWILLLDLVIAVYAFRSALALRALTRSERL
jgi:hypothetical protein